MVREKDLILCSSSGEALTALRLEDVRLLITDTNMPGMTGVDLLRFVRSEERWKTMPVIVLFNGLSGSPLTGADIVRIGATLVMTKDEFLPQARELVGRLLHG